MTNEEIAARAIADAETPVGGGYMHDGHLDGLTCEALAAAVVAALTEAGRLVPDGCVVIPRDAAERAEWACGTIAIQRWATNDPKTEAARLALSSALDKRDASET